MKFYLFFLNVTKETHGYLQIFICLFTGQSELYKVLKAYTVYNPKEGYCQAQAPIAAALLMNMPAEEAFWCLICICENYVPGYYASGTYRNC